ncbi:Meckel syndrome type 1 protein homolog [Glossina fuscipes]|uniref:Meckel syndrome type 1 protein homolog n=1 Tax=Glossina fuscipes TaxID=7396 RepID=A0A9C5Z8N2_9MUSC|nr:Meckel syndrome type 1 protein homolog [Glossina fuscipes]KAI9581824.1 hypothetical protein GQX74_010141 [Glossina fuscipes]
MFNKIPKSSGLYQIKGNIDLLQLKVHLRAMNSLLKLPSYGIKETKLEEFEQYWTFRNNGSQKSFENDIVDVAIKWQQKLLSAEEVELYSSSDNCTTDIQKEYHQWLTEFKNNPKKDTRTQISRFKNYKTSDFPKMAIGRNLISMGNVIFTYVDKDDFRTKKNMSQQRDTWQEKPSEIMYIYAALNPDTMLAVLKWYDDLQLLHIYPNFTDYYFNTYYIEINTNYRNLYSYGIANASPEINCRNSVINCLTFVPELFHTKGQMLRSFSSSPKTTQKYLLLFEILAISGTEYKSIHVRYHIKTPPSFLLEDGILDATTHSVSTSSSLNKSINIGFCWQMTLVCKSKYSHKHRLHIFFEVISTDSWDRERVEGYAYHAINLLQVHQECVTLKCMRPRVGLFDAFTRYFIGGFRHSDFIKFFVNIRQEHRNEVPPNFHLRYSAQMQNTCQLNFKWQDIKEQNCELLQTFKASKHDVILDDIMIAYRKARVRLETITLKKCNKNKIS